MKTSHVKLIPQSPLRLGLLLIPLVLGCFALSSAALAVTPARDGGYPNQNTAEGDDALFSLTTGTPPPGVIETYKVVNGMNIRATVYNVDDGRTHRVAIVTHGGVYNAGDMERDVAQELSQFGFMGVAIEYRLAPPHTEMNTPAHPFPGQNDINDDGYYPEQTDDVRDAIVHYRDDPRSNGQVVLIGGSAGGSHSLYLAATGTLGYDMPDLAVMLSCGVSNLADPNQYALDCADADACPHRGVANYLNIPDPAPLPPTGSDLELAQDASPTQWMHVGMCPFWAMCSSRDSLGIPTSTGFNIRSYLPDNTPGVLENGENGIVPTALAIGLRESTASVPEADSFKATIVAVSVWSHAFHYWDQVKGEVITWISAPIPPPQIRVTVQTNPTGRSFTVDGTTYTAAQRFSWVPGSSHTIATTSPQSGGTRVQYAWTKWSDHGAISHTVAPTTNTTYTGTFETQYFLTMTHGTGGRVSPASGWKNSGATVSISATPANGFSFSNWTGTGTGSYSGTNNPASITMGGPITETATFIHN